MKASQAIVSFREGKHVIIDRIAVHYIFDA